MSTPGDSSRPDKEIVSALRAEYKQRPLSTEVVHLDWEKLPYELDPGGGQCLQWNETILLHAKLHGHAESNCYMTRFYMPNWYTRICYMEVCRTFTV